MDPLRRRFAATAALVAEKEERNRAQLSDRVARFVPLSGDERVLDAGAGTGALAFALAPHVREVLAVDLVPELLDEGRRRGAEFPNVSFVEGDVMRLDLEGASFDLAATLRTLHHLARPELVVAELTRVTKPGGRILVVDQIAPVDPLAAVELNRFERARDPSHTRALADVDLRGLFEANGLVLERAEVAQETRELEPYLDLAACQGDARERARAAAPGENAYTADIGWYLLVKQQFRA